VLKNSNFRIDHNSGDRCRPRLDRGRGCCLNARLGNSVETRAITMHSWRKAPCTILPGELIHVYDSRLDCYLLIKQAR
jgi:hypothetical protein